MELKYFRNLGEGITAYFTVQGREWEIYKSTGNYTDMTKPDYAHTSIMIAVLHLPIEATNAQLKNALN